MKRSRSDSTFSPSSVGFSPIERRLSPKARESACQLAHELSAMALDASQSATRAHVFELVHFAEKRLPVLLSRPCQSLKSISGGQVIAQAASQFFLAGVSSESLFKCFCRGISLSLLYSFADRSTWPSLSHVRDILEHLAICGYLGKDDVMQDIFSYLKLMSHDSNSSQDFISEVLEFLSSYEQEEQGFWLHMSDGRPLKRLWELSARKKKVRDVHTKLTPGTRHVESHHRLAWKNQISNELRGSPKPLVLDLGCGYGVSLLGLAFSRQRLNLQDCNFIGCDLSAAAISYANNLSQKWGLSSFCRFYTAPVEAFLEWCSSNYHGPIIKILIQFPTPYKLPTGPTSVYSEGKGSKGNLQLPSLDNGFMVTPKLIDLALSSLRSDGMLFIQSNVEDVAVTIRGLVEYSSTFSSSFQALASTENPYSEVPSQPTQREVRWAEMGGERAVGMGWLSVSPFGYSARTETEAAYMLDGKRVYRIGWKLFN